MDTNFGYGKPPATLRDKYHEAHDLIMRAWTEPEPFAFNGKYTQLRYVNIWPRPMQKPHPPVWIPGGGSIETWEWVTENDYLFAYLSYSGYKRARRSWTASGSTSTSTGKDMNPYRAGFLQFVGVAETDAQAEELYAEAAEYFYERCLHVYPGFAEAPGYRSMRSLAGGPGDRHRRGRAAQCPRPRTATWKDYLDDGHDHRRQPEARRRSRSATWRPDLRIGHLMPLLQFGNMTKETTMYNTQMFAERVLPNIQGLWGEWEDKWWIKPIENRQAPRSLSVK